VIRAIFHGKPCIPLHAVSFKMFYEIKDAVECQQEQRKDRAFSGKV